MLQRPLPLALFIGLLGCATAAPSSGIEPPALPAQNGGESPAENLPVHINEQWWAFRGAALKLSAAAAHDRDAAMSGKKPPPPGFWDTQVATEAVSLWGEFCNVCHGGRRRLEEARKMKSPAPGWGEGAGLFFGTRRSYEDVFFTIANGKADKSVDRPRMPAWGGKLSREMIWAMIYFIEYQSGGIEGRFPPSLYPSPQRPGGP